MEAIVAGEWINGMCSSEEAEFMAELLGNCSLPNESTHFMVSPSFNAEAAMYSEETSMCSFSQGTSFSSCTLFPFSSQEGYYSALSHHVSGTNADNLTTMDYCKNGFGDDSVDVMGGDDFLNRDVSNDSTQSDDNERGLLLVVPRNEMVTSSPSESKKRSRVPCDVPRSKKSTKCAKMDNDNNSNNNALAIQSQSQSRSQRQTSSNYCSEDESNEMNYNNSCSTSKGKRAANPTRASRGSATDPQSLYARKRRERINERLKVLQTLVPNGTKVDISTMLEEAVEYVKFLQLQIKLLSSDDLWMYSPIAYNGMDIGLDLRISTAAAQQSS